MALSKKNKTKEEPEGVYVYLGPSIRGVIQNGSIYFGTRQNIIQSLSAAVGKYPEIATLIIADVDIIKSKAKIKNGGNELSHAFKALSAK